MDPYQRTDNRQPMVDQEPPIGKGSWSQNKIPSKQQLRVKEGKDLDEGGPRTERCQAIGASQLEGPWTEEPLEENLHQREGSRAPSRL